MSAGSGTENGWALDCWFSENPSSMYKNIFDQNSFPNSNSFSGAASLITIKNFSSRSPHMTMTVEIGKQVIRRDTLLQRELSNTNINSFPTSTKNHLYIPTSKGIFALQNNGRNLFRNNTDLSSAIIITNSVAVYQQASSEIVAGVQDSVLSIFQLNSPNNQGAFDSLKIFTQTIRDNSQLRHVLLKEVLLLQFLLEQI